MALLCEHHAMIVILFASVCLFPLMVTSQQFLVNQVYQPTVTDCTGIPKYSTVTKANTCIGQAKFFCANSTHYSIESFNSTADCTNGIVDSSNYFPRGQCLSYSASNYFYTDCQSTLPDSLANYYYTTQYSSPSCTSGTETQITGYLLDTCYQINDVEWAKYTCESGQVNKRSGCSDDQCSQCTDVTMELVGTCTSGYKATCTNGCDLTARQKCDETFSQCDLKSSACECYQVWGQCVYDSGCDDDGSAEKDCQEFCGQDSCKCDFANPCTDDSLSTSLVMNLLLVGGSVLIYFFLML